MTPGSGAARRVGASRVFSPRSRLRRIGRVAPINGVAPADPSTFASPAIPTRRPRPLSRPLARWVSRHRRCERSDAARSRLHQHEHLRGWHPRERVPRLPAANLDRPNLTLLLNANVTRVTFDSDRASGVELVASDGAKRVRATREVIIAAGAIHGAKLLMLSGIGDAAQLRKFGIAGREFTWRRPELAGPFDRVGRRLPIQG